MECIEENPVPVDVHNLSRIDAGPRVVSANLFHLDEIVQIHLAAFEGFFLESMGKRFLKELYRGFLVEPSGLCLVAITGRMLWGLLQERRSPRDSFGGCCGVVGMRLSLPALPL